MKRIVRREQDVWDIGRLTGWGLAYVYLPWMALLGVAFAVSRVIPGWGVEWKRFVYGWAGLGFLSFVFVFLAAHWRVIRGLGTVMLFSYVIGATYYVTGVAIVSPSHPQWPGWMSYEFASGLVCGVMFLKYVTGLWLLFRGMLWVAGYRIVTVEHVCCVECGYDLRRNTSLVCPECGRGFTFAELGVTAEEFRELGERVE